MQTDPLASLPLLPARAKETEPPPLVLATGANGGAVILGGGGRPNKPAFNLKVVWDAATAAGLDLGPLPKSGAHPKCPLCVFRGIDPTLDFDPTTRPPEGKKAKLCGKSRGWKRPPPRGGNEERWG